MIHPYPYLFDAYGKLLPASELIAQGKMFNKAFKNSSKAKGFVFNTTHNPKIGRGE